MSTLSGIIKTITDSVNKKVILPKTVSKAVIHNDGRNLESIINTDLNNKANSVHSHTMSNITDFPESMPASDVYDWAKSEQPPTYNKGDVGLGNVDNTSDMNKPISTLMQTALNGKVSISDGMGLTHNDLTDTLKDNYDSAYTHSTTDHAPTNAQSNIIETVKVNGTALTPISKAVDITVPTGTAASKSVDTSISASSTSTNLPTSAAVASFVEGKGYKTTDNNTTYSLTQDSTNGHKITLTPSIGTAQTITIPDNNTDTKVTSVVNHYTPSGGTNTSASGGTLTDITNSSSGVQVVTGVTKDAAGHVTGVTSVALKSVNTNTDTHYTTGLKVGASATATSNASATNGNVYVNVLDNTTVRDSHKIVGSGATTVTSDANGVITISSTDNNTTYSAATTSTAGLMSAADKTKLDGIVRGSRWNTGVYVTGTNTTPTIFSNTGITDSLVGDMYLNSSTYNLYQCTISGNASTAKWKYICNIKGTTGSTGISSGSWQIVLV